MKPNAHTQVLRLRGRDVCEICEDTIPDTCNYCPSCDMIVAPDDGLLIN